MIKKTVNRIQVLGEILVFKFSFLPKLIWLKNKWSITDLLFTMHLYIITLYITKLISKSYDDILLLVYIFL